MRILWAVSSVGRGHVVRDIALADRLRNASGATVDWLAPDPAGDFLRERGYRVLDCSRELAGSGKVYAQVFADCIDEFNLMNYARADTGLQKHDFAASVSAWQSTAYDILVGDEAFWLLTGFNRKWARKPAPFVFITDFIGTRAMRPRIRDRLLSWYFNFGFSMSHAAPDAFVHLGQAEEIPDERLGFMLPSRREWARRKVAVWCSTRLGLSLGDQRPMSIGEAMAMLSLCDGFAGNDSGSMHVAGALGIPTVGLYGSTRPERTGPLGTRTRVIYHPIECSPCLEHTCRFGHYNCLTQITAEEVLHALEELGALRDSRV